MKKNATKEEREYMRKVAALGCAVCRRLGFPGTPAEVHHPRIGVGMAQRASHFDTIPLCPEHHRGATGVHSLGKKGLFEKTYGFSEQDLIEDTKRLVGRKND